jgi:hypothetical protein
MSSVSALVNCGLYHLRVGLLKGTGGDKARFCVLFFFLFPQLLDDASAERLFSARMTAESFRQYQFSPLPCSKTFAAGLKSRLAFGFFVDAPL